MTPVTRWLPIIALAPAIPAGAQTAPPSPITISGEATLVSDYRFRGISRTSRDPAVQGNVSIDSLTGIYGRIFASAIGGYVARGGDVEIDLTAGYRKLLAGTTIDGGLRYFVYPGHGDANVAEPFISASRSYGPLTAKIGGALAWKQHSLGLTGDKRGGEYLYGELAAGIPRTPVSVTAHVGHSLTANAMTLGQRYTDWSVAASYTLRALTFSLAYVDTGSSRLAPPDRGANLPGNAGGATVVGAVAIAF